jgi:hypothetical protein
MVAGGRADAMPPFVRRVRSARTSRIVKEPDREAVIIRRGLAQFRLHAVGKIEVPETSAKPPRARMTLAARHCLQRPERAVVFQPGAKRMPPYGPASDARGQRCHIHFSRPEGVAEHAATANSRRPFIGLSVFHFPRYDSSMFPLRQSLGAPERRAPGGETEDLGLLQGWFSNTGRDVTMGALADSFVAFAQPLIDETDGSMEQLNKAFGMAQVCYNLALLPEESRQEMLVKLQAELAMDDDEFGELRRDIIEPMIRRHADMFGRSHRWDSMIPSLQRDRLQPHARRVAPPQTPAVIDRYAPCPCNSGKKYKFCCGLKRR